MAYTDGKYVTFTNAPLPLEETGTTVEGVQVAFKDISGGSLPGISKWTTSIGGEFIAPVTFVKQAGNFFLAFDTYYRSDFSSSPSPSAYLNIDGYALLNAKNRENDKKIWKRTEPGEGRFPSTISRRDVQV